MLLAFSALSMFAHAETNSAINAPGSMAGAKVAAPVAADQSTKARFAVLAANQRDDQHSTARYGDGVTDAMEQARNAPGDVQFLIGLTLLGCLVAAAIKK